MSDELRIEDLVVGDGKAVVKGALITTHYEGWLDDGTLFDSSRAKGRPFQCVIGTGRVIKGWDQGLMGMRVEPGVGITFGRLGSDGSGTGSVGSDVGSGSGSVVLPPL